LREHPFEMREDQEGWTVFDVFTGMAVVIAGVRQTGLSEVDARDLKRLLNGKAFKDDRRLRQ
jgi:hypothetical protein